MEARPLTKEEIALTEKKMDMTLDDIIKMAKTKTAKPKSQRVSNRNQKFVKNITQEKSAKMRRFMDSRSSLRQVALAKKRSNFQSNQFPMAVEAARRAAVAPIRNRNFNNGRPLNAIKTRVTAPPAQRKVAMGGFAMKHPSRPVNIVSKQKLQTLDSLFANMKEQRMRVQSQRSNVVGRRSGGFHQSSLPWGRGRFGK